MTTDGFGLGQADEEDAACPRCGNLDECNPWCNYKEDTWPEEWLKEMDQTEQSGPKTS